MSFEVIIVDNNSKDRTVEKSKKYPVKILYIKKFFPGKLLILVLKKREVNI